MSAKGSDQKVAVPTTKPEKTANSLVSVCRSGDLVSVERLVETGADVNVLESNSTPLTAASRAGQWPVVVYLLEKGADKDKPASGGMTPMYVAAYADQLGVV